MGNHHRVVQTHYMKSTPESWISKDFYDLVGTMAKGLRTTFALNEEVRNAALSMRKQSVARGRGSE